MIKTPALRRTAIADPRRFGKPVGAVILDSLRDPEYRRHYLRYSLRTAIAAAVKTLRLRRGLTQTQLARRAGIPQPQLARLEGVQDARIPTLDLLIRVLAALEVHAALLLHPERNGNRGLAEIALL